MFPRARTWSYSGARSSSVPPPPPPSADDIQGICPPCLERGLALRCTPGKRPCPPCALTGLSARCAGVKRSSNLSSELQQRNEGPQISTRSEIKTTDFHNHKKATFDDEPMFPMFPEAPLPPIPFRGRPSLSGASYPFPAPLCSGPPTLHAYSGAFPLSDSQSLPFSAFNLYGTLDNAQSLSHFAIPPPPRYRRLSASSGGVPPPPLSTRPRTLSHAAPDLPPDWPQTTIPQASSHPPLRRRPSLSSLPSSLGTPPHGLPPSAFPPSAQVKPLGAQLPAVHLALDWRWVVIRATDAATEKFGYRPSHMCGRWLPTFISISEHSRLHELMQQLLPKNWHTARGLSSSAVAAVGREPWEKLKVATNAMPVSGSFHFNKRTGESILVRLQIWRSAFVISGEHSGLIIVKVTPIGPIPPRHLPRPNGLSDLPPLELPALHHLDLSMRGTGRSTSMGFHPSPSRSRTSSMSFGGIQPPPSYQSSLPPLQPLCSMNPLPPLPQGSSRSRRPSFAQPSHSYNGDFSILNPLSVAPDNTGRSAWGRLDSYAPESYRALLALPPPPTHTPKK